MKKISYIEKIDFWIFGTIINWCYPLYFRPRYGYVRYYTLFLECLLPSKILRLNKNVKWPVHFTSRVVGADFITKGFMCDPGDNLHNYIQANNGIHFGSNIELGPGVQIISSNHDPNDLRKIQKGKPIIIGNNVWIGGNSIVLPEVKIGDNVIIGAGSVVTKDIPSNSIAVGNPCKVIKQKPLLEMDFSAIIFNRKLSLEWQEKTKKSRVNKN
ncbi:MAG: acetyltransferase-like isoleucine patch superfamily enzyme [Maribacter sp.]